MSVSVTMPQLGESVTEGTVTRWLKQVGDTVVADEPLLEVSTDKVDTEIPAPASGVLLAIHVAEDSVVLVGAELGVIGDSAPVAAAPAPDPAPAPVAPVPGPTPAPAPVAPAAAP
ncbi:MAG: biotin/lipoyl-containing protein, partial [Candidatus Nanopelagicales bacterium]